MRHRLAATVGAGLGTTEVGASEPGIDVGANDAAVALDPGLAGGRFGGLLVGPEVDVCVLVDVVGALEPQAARVTARSSAIAGRTSERRRAIEGYRRTEGGRSRSNMWTVSTNRIVFVW